MYCNFFGSANQNIHNTLLKTPLKFRILDICAFGAGFQGHSLTVFSRRLVSATRVPGPCVCISHGQHVLEISRAQEWNENVGACLRGAKVPHRTHRIQLLYGRCATVVRGLTEDTPPLPRSQTLCPTTRTGPANNLAGKLHIKSSTHMCQQVPALCVAHKVFPPANRQSGELSVCHAVVAAEENDKMRDRLGSENSDGNTCRDASGHQT